MTSDHDVTSSGVIVSPDRTSMGSPSSSVLGTRRTLVAWVAKGRASTVRVPSLSRESIIVTSETLCEGEGVGGDRVAAGGQGVGDRLGRLDVQEDGGGFDEVGEFLPGLAGAQ